MVRYHRFRGIDQLPCGTIDSGAREVAGGIAAAAF
jgi:hypothetical protein